MRIFHSAVLATALALTSFGQGKINPPKAGWNLFSKDQDIQLGKEAASQVEKQYAIVNDPEVTTYLNALGQKLAKSKYAGDFPFTFKLVSDESINAFALPGGPMFVHTGLIKAAETEGQLVGVLAHEMSHVALRHGTHQATTANALQIVPAIAGAVAGGGMMGQLAQMGLGLGENSLMLKFSRSAESQADYNGGLMMASVGYSPIEMARFFEKLEAQTGKQGFISRMMSDHPSPGNRVKASEDLAKLLPPQQYNNDSTAFNKEKALVTAMKPQPKPVQPAATTAGGTVRLADLRPAAQLKAFDGNAHNFQYPSNWEAFGDATTPSVTVAPRAGVMQTQQRSIGRCLWHHAKLFPASEHQRRPQKRHRRYDPKYATGRPQYEDGGLAESYRRRQARHRHATGKCVGVPGRNRSRRGRVRRTARGLVLSGAHRAQERVEVGAANLPARRAVGEVQQLSCDFR